MTTAAGKKRSSSGLRRKLRILIAFGPEILVKQLEQIWEALLGERATDFINFEIINLNQSDDEIAVALSVVCAVII